MIPAPTGVIAGSFSVWLGSTRLVRHMFSPFCQMSDSQPASANRAVFLSYVSQDAEAARRICEAQRAVGVEVWFDQNELVTGEGS